MPTEQPVFALPSIPAARCLFYMRKNPLATRAELVEITGLSQPTVTRAVTALLDNGLIIQRPDLTHSKGRGRPTVPVEWVEPNWVQAGIAVGTQSTYIGLFDVRGRTIRDTDIELPIAQMNHTDVIEHLMAGLNRLSVGLPRPLAAVGVTFPGFVRADGIIDAPSLGWSEVDVASRLRYQFSVPVTISAAVPAILGSELQHPAQPITEENPTLLALFADDSLGAAISSGHGVTQIALSNFPELTTAGLLDGTEARTLAELVDTPEARPRLDARATGLGRLAAELIAAHSPQTVVLAGSAFIDDPHAPALCARAIRQHLPSSHADVALRLIPTHREIVRAIARAVALDQVIRDPVRVAAATNSVPV